MMLASTDADDRSRAAHSIGCEASTIFEAKGLTIP
jgi:hypothetical protein